MSFPFVTISSNVTSLNTGSYYSQKDLSTFNVSQSKDIFFAESSQDIIEFATYDIVGNLNNWKTLSKNDTYSVINKTYKDVNNNSFTYNYKKFNSSYIISSDRQILLNTVEDLNDSGILSGSYVVSYNFLRNVAGNDKYKLVIKSISVDRKELQLIPSFRLDVNNEENLLNSLNFEGFSRQMILVNDLVDLIIEKIKTFNSADYYPTAAANNPEAVSSIKSIFGFKTDTEIIDFLNKIYYGFSINSKDINNTLTNNSYDGIEDFITNWLYTYYKNLVNISDLKGQFKYITDTAVSKNLQVFNYNYLKLDSTNSVTTFIDVLFFDDFISPMLDEIGKKYNDKFYSYLKNSLNFGNNEFYPVLNHSYTTDNNNNTILIVKLFDYLPQNIGLRDTCWISNISTVPLIQKVILSYPVDVKRYKISGPNFKINPRIDSVPKNKVSDYKSKNQLNSNNLENQIDFNKKLQQLNVDYTSFKNFIVFSSAQLRIKLFKNKLNTLDALNSELYAIDQKISTNVSSSSSSAISASYSYDSNSINAQINDIYNSFDGFDSYLFSNQSIVSGSAYNDYLADAVEYDFYNRDSLVNNTPEYINTDSNNSEYLVFLSMAGHFFDNIYLYIQNFPTTQYVNNSQDNSFISNIANIMLEQFGWTPISSVDDLSLENYYLTNSEHSSSLTMSGVDKMKNIWNRVLNNLPMIYKTKGTEESIRLLSNIYGIPSGLVKVKEFGGNNLSDEDKSSYIFDKTYYFTRYSGSNEYIQIPYSSDVNSIEFKLNIDTAHVYKWNDKIDILYKDDNFKVYLVKDKQDFLGTLTFQLYDTKFISDSLPFFNGQIFNVLIKKEDYLQDEQLVLSGQYPSTYYFIINHSYEDRTIFDSKNEILLNRSYATYFTSSTNLYFGNTTASVNNFFGNLDKINIWLSPLSQSAFTSHCKNFDAYDNGNTSTTYNDLYFRYSFMYPQNFASSSVFTFTNANKYYETSSNYYGYAYNFPSNAVEYISASCHTTPVSVYPFQFDKIFVRQNISYKNLGPNKFKNSKINRVSQQVLARLMPNESSTTQTLINNDSNLAAVYISPYDGRDDDIVDFLGEYNLMDAIGDPANLYKNNYDSLTVLRENYNKNNLSEKVLFQEFMTIYKNYIDSSFFESVKQLIPARSKFINGVLIEQSLIERNKYQNKPIQPIDIGVLDIIPNQDLYNINTSFISMNVGTVNSGVPIQIDSYTDLSQTKYISNDAVNDRLSAFSVGGSYYNYKERYGFVNGVIYKTTKNLYNVNYIENISTFNYATSSIIQFSLANSASLDSSYRDTDSYPVGHYSLIRNGNRRTGFLTTQYNTVNQSGSLDGSLPITMTSVNVGQALTTLVSA
jgi:hypothetical protein